MPPLGLKRNTAQGRAHQAVAGADVSAHVTESPSAQSRSMPPLTPPHGDTRFDRRLGEILTHATAVFYEKGYEGASMRDLSRVSGMSLAGLYYYFESKEKLLYLIQKETFTTIIQRLRERLQAVVDPEARVRVFISNHLEYFLANMQAMKVLSHEADVLKSGYGKEIQDIKREYYRICFGLIEDLRRREKGVGSAAASNGSRAVSARVSARNSVRGEQSAIARAAQPAGDHERDETRIAVLSLFGMINWIYTWHNPLMDGDAGELARVMGDTFLRGLFSPCTNTAKASKPLQRRSI